MTIDKILASPTKKLFIDILTNDVTAKTCILDLIDNSIDSYVRNNISDKRDIKLTLSPKEFVIFDNCGGISLNFLKNKVFKFGAENLSLKNPTLGMYGIGLKRSIFKLGKYIELETDNGENYCKIKLDVTQWEKNDDWSIPLVVEDSKASSINEHFTKVKILNLNPDINKKFSLTSFYNEIKETINTTYLLFLKDKIKLSINNTMLMPYDLLMPKEDDFNPSVYRDFYDEIDISIICFIDPSEGSRLENSINKVGWNIFCNDRLILANDTTKATGWQGGSKNDKSVLPKYHAIYNEFRGIVFLKSNNPFKLPLNTSKSGLNTESKNYNYILEKMIMTARPVIDYLTKKYKEQEKKEKEIEDSISENKTRTIEFKPILELDMNSSSEFKAPDTSIKNKDEEKVRLTYEKPKKLVVEAMNYLKVRSYKKVGEKTFDYFIEMEEIQDEQ